MMEQIFLMGTAAHGEPTLERIFPEGLQPMPAQGKKCEGEGVAQRNCCILTIPLKLSCSTHVGVEESGVKLSLGKDEGKVFLNFLSLFLIT